MGSSTVQLILAAVCVALAALSIARRALGLWQDRRGGGCGTGCGGCGSSDSQSTDAPPRNLVGIEDLERSASPPPPVSSANDIPSDLAQRSS